MADQDKILQFLQLSGPTLPGKVAKHIGSNILLASALLSDLVSQGKVKISHLKIGGSPLYYLPAQKEKLYQFAPGNLNPKDLQSLQTLKERKVLRESEMELLMKVSLRSLKDFAVPLQVTANGARELFWKWHLLSEEETNNILRQLISPVEESAEAVFQPSAPARTEEPARESITPVVRETEEGAVKEESKELIKKPFLSKLREKITRKKKADEFFPQL